MAELIVCCNITGLHQPFDDNLVSCFKYAPKQSKLSINRSAVRQYKTKLAERGLYVWYTRQFNSNSTAFPYYC